MELNQIWKEKGWQLLSGEQENLSAKTTKADSFKTIPSVLNGWEANLAVDGMDCVSQTSYPC